MLVLLGLPTSCQLRFSMMMPHCFVWVSVAHRRFNEMLLLISMPACN